MPSLTFIPNDVPRVAYSTSCTASAFPARTALMCPVLIIFATASAAPVCTIAGPPTSTILPRFFFVFMMSSATFRAIC